MKSGTTLRVFLGILMFMAWSCGSDDPAAPIEEIPPKLGDLTLSLRVTPGTGLISDFFEAEVITDPAADMDKLEELSFLWGWRSPTSFTFGGKGESAIRIQFPRLGNQQIRLRVSDGDSTVDFSRIVSVTGGTQDGSLVFIPVSGGSFLRGDPTDSTNLINQTPQREIVLSPFELARTEVTNQLFAEVVNYALDQGWASLSETGPFLLWQPDDLPVVVMQWDHSDLLTNGGEVTVPPGLELNPVTGMRWMGAPLFCNWLSLKEGLQPCYSFSRSNALWLYEASWDLESPGYRLPTEAEWEKAARGGFLVDSGTNPLPDRRYPWGNEPVTVTLTASITGSRFADYDRIFASTFPVGSFPEGAGPYGHQDLFGNAAEWCWDWFGFDYYETSPDQDPAGSNEALPGVDDYKVLRGDSYVGPLIPAIGALSVEHGVQGRRWAKYHYGAPFLGMRLARNGG